MDIGQPESSAAAMLMPTAKTTPMNRVCSERHCSNAINGPFRGNICNQCISAKSLKGRSFSHVKAAATGDIARHPNTQGRLSLRQLGAELFRKEIPTSVRSRFLMATDCKSQTDNTRPYLSVTHRNEHNRPHYLTNASYSRTRPVEHFNSRGELILDAFSYHIPSTSSHASAPAINSRATVVCIHTSGRESCPRCSATNAVPVIPSTEGRHTTTGGPQGLVPIALDANKPVPDTDGGLDLDLDNLELKYPEVLDCKPPIPQQVSSHEAELRNPPTKRQKLSHSIIDLTGSPSTALSQPTNSQATSATANPKLDNSSKNPPRSYKLCCTDNCAGIVSSGSFARRCLTCVRREWNAKRDGPNQISLPQNVGESDHAVTRTPDISTVPKKAKKKDKLAVSSNLRESDTFYDKRLESPDLEDYINLNGLVEVGLSGSETPSEEHFQRSRPHAKDLSGSSFDSNVEAPSVDKLDAENTNSKQISGWDSDLSDVTESPERDSDSQLSSEEEIKLSRPSVPSGFKIRIPPRPAGAYMVKCASQRCNQLLATGYRWKSCVVCRARSRDYQRRKRNLPTRLRLQDELMDSRSMGTPLAVELSQEKSKYTETAKVVPGARLCAIRTCTFIIPPVGEYRWKMCSLCRLRRRERRRLEQNEDASLSTPEPGNSRRKAVVPDSNFMLNSLEFLRKTVPKEGKGKCRSLDCGMMLAISSSQECRQCIARRLWLVNRGPSNYNRPEGPKLLHRGSKKPLERPRGPAPYPQYKCFSALLYEFKNRLGGFLRAQSIFFLFNQQRSANVLFAFDGEFSVVALDFDVVKRKEEVDANALKLKREIEYVGRIKFSPKRLVSVLEEGGISVRFSCFYPVPILQPKQKDGQTAISTLPKSMQCELEIAVLPDHSHRFIPGQRTIIRFRLFG